MAWYNDVIGVATKTVLPAVAQYGGQVVGGAVGTVLGGPAGTVAGAAAGKLASDAIQGGVKRATRGKRRKPKARPIPRGEVPVAVKRAKVVSSKGGRRKRVREVAVVFTVDGDGKMRKRVVPKRVKRTARPRGVPAMVLPNGATKGDALATAGRLIASLQSADPKLAAYAKGVLNATAARARKGDPAAKRAVSVLKAAQSVNKSKGRLTGFLVTNSGRVVIGSFLQTG